MCRIIFSASRNDVFFRAESVYEVAWDGAPMKREILRFSAELIGS